MSILVEQQDETVDAIQETAANVEKDTEAGTGHTNTAVTSARAARKKRWICFGLFILLLIIVAIVIAVVILNNKKSERSFVTSLRYALAYGFSQNKHTKVKSVAPSHSYIPTRPCVLPARVQCSPFLPEPWTTLRDVVFTNAFLSRHHSPCLFMSFCGFRARLFYMHLFTKSTSRYAPTQNQRRSDLLKAELIGEWREICRRFPIQPRATEPCDHVLCLLLWSSLLVKPRCLVPSILACCICWCHRSCNLNTDGQS